MAKKTFKIRKGGRHIVQPAESNKNKSEKAKPINEVKQDAS